MVSFTVNKRRVNLDVDPSTPLLWVLRENLGLRNEIRFRHGAVRRLYRAPQRRGGALLRGASVEGADLPLDKRPEAK